ncbi:D-2-hydroxyglutarate dehydrogenase YdiJ [Agaribacterium haliotis]|uniref:D-2-hydroxyglutarate dehydrogenase YdiJ n=1 Tax=Agaribacterium haliotis TaxID=2013869 RepID=UPI000BB55851|nr:FAD-binding and (Fe-S)-binding domain-containing protein [Agaribacterium haliotis]
MIKQLAQCATVAPLYQDFLKQLQTQGFSGDLSHDYAERCAQATDNSIYQRLPQATLYPRGIDDLQILTRLAAEKNFRDIVLTARGGGTGTNGQSLTDGIVVDLSRHMNQVLEINAAEGWVRVQSGVVKDQLNAALKAHGLFFAPELSTSNRATIGGMINTDASGQGSCLYGKTRDHVLELHTVLLGGEVLHSQAIEQPLLDSISEQQNRSGLIHRLCHSIYQEHKEKIDASFPPLNRCLTGYDLAHIHDEQGLFNLNNILCGSEGTLGFIAEAKLNVLPIPKCSALVVVKYADFEASLRDAPELMQTGPTSIETIDSKVLNLAMQDVSWTQVEEFFNGDNASQVQGINLLEFSADSEAELEQNMATLLKQLKSNKLERPIGYALAMGSDAVKRIWAMRKLAVGLLGNAKGEARPVPFVEDTAVAPEKLADFIMAFRAILDRHQLQYGMFGHVDAGVLHVRPALDMKDPEQEQLAWKISDEVAALCQEYGGLLWGEHGKGLRSAYAPEFFGELYPELQRIKAAFDPFNQLNPGKIATPNEGSELIKINEVTTRGQHDRQIEKEDWQRFASAVYCNGNGACHNWNFHDAMCPSYKATRKRTESPKGRSSLVREWMRLQNNEGVKLDSELKTSALGSLLRLPQRAWHSLRKATGSEDFSHEVYASMSTCLSCKSCAGQCPIKVDVPDFRSKFLALYHTRYLRPLKDYLVASLESMLPVMAKAPWAYNLVMGNFAVKALLKHGVGFVDGPMISRSASADKRLPSANLEALNKLSGEQKQRSLILVQDAFTRYFDAGMVNQLVDTLEALGFKVWLAPFKANGKPLHVHGFLQAFSKCAEKNMAMLKQLQQSGVALVGIDPSMTLTYRSEYPKTIGTEKCVEVQLLQEFLFARLDLLPKLSLPSTQNRNYVLLPHCTEKTNVGSSNKQWQAVFEQLGLQLTIPALGCCGMAGTFGHEQRNRELSTQIYDLSWRNAVANNDAGQLLATGYSCRCQIKREQQVQVQHPLAALSSLFEK